MSNYITYNPYITSTKKGGVSAVFLSKKPQNFHISNTSQAAVKEYVYCGFGLSCSPLLHYHYVSTSLTVQIPNGNAIAKPLALLHTGKERDSETGFSYFGARYYDSDLMTAWLSVDPLADKYPNISPYAYCAWNPVKLVDPDGESPRIYVETSGLFGHAFVTIGSGKNTIVYTYGRYAELGKDKSSSRGTTPTGEGVLIKLEGEEAMQYINKQINSNDASVFEFKNASDELVGKYFDKKLNDSNKVPKIGKYANAENAKVVDEYNLLTNNCVTTSVDGIQVGMQEKTILDMLISPNDLKDFLNIMSLLSTNVRKIEHNEVRKELNF